MIRRLMLLTTLSVLVGVFVLSAPVLAGNSAQPGKATTPTTIVQTSPSKAAVSIQPSFSPSSIIGALRFSLRNWLGWPYIHILDPKPSVPDEPLKSSTDPNKRNDDVARDHGGSTDDL